MIGQVKPPWNFLILNKYILWNGYSSIDTHLSKSKRVLRHSSKSKNHDYRVDIYSTSSSLVLNMGVLSSNSSSFIYVVWHRINVYSQSKYNVLKTTSPGLYTHNYLSCFPGFVCVRGFDQKTRAPRPLIARLHFPVSKLTKVKWRTGEN